MRLRGIRPLILLAVVLAGAVVAGCSDDNDSGDGSGPEEREGSAECASIFVIGEAAPADTAAFVVESPIAQGDEVAGAVECEDEVGEMAFRTVVQFDCHDDRTVYYARLDRGAGYAAWQDGGTFFEVPISPGPGASNLCS